MALARKLDLLWAVEGTFLIIIAVECPPKDQMKDGYGNTTWESCHSVNGTSRLAIFALPNPSVTAAVNWHGNTSFPLCDSDGTLHYLRMQIQNAWFDQPPPPSPSWVCSFLWALVVGRAELRGSASISEGHALTPRAIHQLWCWPHLGDLLLTMSVHYLISPLSCWAKLNPLAS